MLSHYLHKISVSELWTVDDAAPRGEVHGRPAHRSVIPDAITASQAQLLLQEFRNRGLGNRLAQETLDGVVLS